MQITSEKGTLNGLGKVKMLTRYTPDGAEVGGFPAVLFEPQLRMLRILQNGPLGNDGKDFVKKALDDVLEKITAVDAAIASEQHG